MTELRDFAAVIFDLDGLVLDTESRYCAAWQQAAAQLGYTGTDTFWTSLSGLHGTAVTTQMQAALGDRFNPTTFAGLSAQCWRNIVEQQGITVKPGFQELLSILKARQIPFALATNSPRLQALECLALAGLQNVFTIVVSPEQVPAAKPAPDLFLAAAQQLCIPINHCLVLEDSYTGVLSAHQAGAQVIYIPSQPVNPLATALATGQISTLSHLAELIDRTLP